MPGLGPRVHRQLCLKLGDDVAERLDFNHQTLDLPAISVGIVPPRSQFQLPEENEHTPSNARPARA